MQIVTEEELVASKATWHHICYQQTANKEVIRRAKERYERRESALGAPTSSEVTNNPTRRSLCPTYEKRNCFFCDEEGSKQNPLHKVATFNAGKTLRDAVDLNNNDTLKVRLNEALTHETPMQLMQLIIKVLDHQCIQFAAIKTLRLSDKAVEAVLVTEMEFLSLLE